MLKVWHQSKYLLDGKRFYQFLTLTLNLSKKKIIPYLTSFQVNFCRETYPRMPPKKILATKPPLDKSKPNIEAKQTKADYAQLSSSSSQNQRLIFLGQIPFSKSLTWHKIVTQEEE